MRSAADMLVVIVNYRTGDLTIDCLRSLRHDMQLNPRVRVVIVDNLSPDDSADQIEQAIRDENFDFATLVRAPDNGGFAYGNNYGIRPALEAAFDERPKYILLLNPDTIVRDNAIIELIDFLNAHPRAGIAGSRLEDPDGTAQRSAFRFHSALSEFEAKLRLGPVSKLLSRSIVAYPVPMEPCRTDWVSGASFAVRREVFEQIGLLDEGYFMYYEEVDFCRRAQLSGWECWYVPASRVVHLVGQASGVGNVQKRLPKYFFDSRRRYFRRNTDAWHWALADLLAIGGLALAQLRYNLTGKTDVDPPKVLSDLVRNSVFVRGFEA